MKSIFLLGSANRNLGAGHLMRLLSIADELHKLNLETFFIGNVQPDTWYAKNLQKRSFIKMEIPYTLPQQSILLFDIYDDLEYKSILELSWKYRIQLMDSHSQNLDFGADIRINFSPRLSTTFVRKESDLLGIEYTPVRSFPRMNKYQNEKKNIVVTGGGGMANLSFIKRLHSMLHTSNYEVAYFSPNFETLCEGPRCKYFELGNSYDSLLGQSHLLISPCSSGIWEALKVGTNVLTFPLTDNQYEFFNIVTDMNLITGYRDFWKLEKSAFFKLLLEALNKEVNKDLQFSNLEGAQLIAKSICDLE